MQETRRIEALGMHALALKKQQATIKPFHSDGCSGGLSFAWQQLAEAIPAFQKKFGSKPVYESCCIEHDKTYWQGDTDDGYNKRRLADQALQQCVIDIGLAQREQLGRELHVSSELIDKSFKITAAMMYHTVRFGGAPCSYLPWRWGFGWPHCSVLSNEKF